MEQNQVVTADTLREMLQKAYGHRPFFYRTDREVAEITGYRNPGSLANLDAQGRGIPVFYIGRRASYRTEDLIEFALSRFSNGKSSC